MLHVDTLGHDLKEGYVGDVHTALQLEPPQLGTPAGYGMKALVSELLTPVQEDALNHDADAGRVVTETPRQDLERAVSVQVGARETDGRPEGRLPREVVPAPTDARTPHQVRAAQVGEDAQYDVIGE